SLWGRRMNWKTALRIVAKAAILFVTLNLLFAWLNPLEALGRLSLYNVILPGRERLPYGENPAESYNLSLYNIPAMFASHVVSRPKAPDEFRVLLIGDSGTWGWLLENDDTLAAQINAANHDVNGKRVVVYNLGYPIMALMKDVLLLDEAMQYQPDMIVWLVTLESFPREQQLFPPIVQNNAVRVWALIEAYHLNLDPNNPRLVTPSLWERTIVGQRRALADWLCLQVYGFSWAFTRIDQAIPEEYTLRSSDFEEDVSWQDYDEPTPLTTENLAFDVLTAGIARAGDLPILIVNEPTFISIGRNSDLRYNAFYPRWAYDAYRDLLAQQAEANGWNYLDLWDVIPPDEFTDTPVHLTAEGVRLLSEYVGNAIMENRE
ncbi:MAG TPA: SGNH/GDSL hydrolase family protein, partial [Oceanobacillus sp.]|nr:SGNH/GDSL hydrolase family protein [Oceanobacillus sp.]